jgi:hypothetical protein
MNKLDAEKTSEYLVDRIGYKKLVGSGKQPKSEAKEEDLKRCDNSAEKYFCRSI